MRNINESWMKDEIQKKCKIEKLKRIKEDILKCGEAYRNVFNGAPFYESWDLASSTKEIIDYMNSNALILSSKYNETMVLISSSKKTILS